MAFHCNERAIRNVMKFIIAIAVMFSPLFRTVKLKKTRMKHFIEDIVKILKENHLLK